MAGGKPIAEVLMSTALDSPSKVDPAPLQPAATTSPAIVSPAPAPAVQQPASGGRSAKKARKRFDKVPDVSGIKSEVPQMEHL